MQARIQTPGAALPAAQQALGQLVGAVWGAGVAPEILHLVHLRVSQINGCSWCTAAGAKQARQAGDSDERLFAIAAWRDAPWFTEAERGALALAEAATRLADREDPVPDAVWEAAARHFDDKPLSALLLWIGLTNLFNRVNVATRLVAGTPMPWEQAA
jgi:AhpD family alkylhydroperoxidase